MEALLLTAALLAQVQTTDLAMPGAKQPIAFLLITPSGNVANTSSSEIIRIVSRLFETHTDFKPEIIDPAAVAGCKGRVGCMVRQVRTDYNRAVYLLPNDTVAPYSEHEAYLEKKQLVYPKYLLLLSNLALGDSDRLSMSLIDTDVALRYFHEAYRDRDDWERQTEVRIAEHAMVGRPIEGELKSEAEARRFLEDHFRQELRRQFIDTGNWEPYGSIEIATPLSGASISIDGVTVGTTVAGVTRIQNIVAGKHALALSHPEHKPYDTELLVERSKAATLSVQMEPAGSPVTAALRQGVLWGGAAVAVAGAVVVGVAASQVDSSVKTFCPVVGDQETSCGGSQFARTGYDAGGAPTFEDDVNSGAILFAPLGYSLAVTGLAWSLGTLFIGDDEDVPWIQLVAGVALGGLTYGLSVLLDGDNPYDAI